MKILLCNRPSGAFGYITDGWLNALRDKGHIVQRYDNNINMWLSFNPDLYIGCSGHKQDIPRRRNAKVAIHVNPYGPKNIEGINENPDSIKWVMDNKPDVVFGYGTEYIGIIGPLGMPYHGYRCLLLVIRFSTNRL